MRTPEFQFFSLKEYKQRMDGLRSRMEQKGVDAMLVYTPENLCYLTGFQTPGYLVYNMLIVPMDRPPVFVTRNGESAMIEPYSWVEDSRTWGDGEDWIATTKDALLDLGLGHKRIGVEYDSQCATIQNYLRLTAILPDVTFVDCSGLVEQGRVIKSPQEIEYMRHAARAVEAAIKAGVEVCEAGMTENDVAAEMHKAQIKAGSEYTGFPMFIRSGSRTLMGHGTWFRKTLEANEIVSMEISACINRYHAAKFAFIYLGEPTKEMIRAFDTVVEANKAARAFIKPGVTCGEVEELMRQIGESANLGLEPDTRVGYSIGLAFPPDWGEGHIISMYRGDSRVLRAGMTFHLTGTKAVTIPGVRSSVVPKGWGGGGKAHCSDTILVTRDGCETITDGLEQTLFVK